MSVTLTLYKPNQDIEFLGCGWMKYSSKEWKKLCEEWINNNCANAPSDEELFGNRWSDGGVHYYINVTERKSYLKNYRGGRRYLKRLFRIKSKTFEHKYYPFQYIPVDIVQYRQGWFLKNRFFKKKFWTIYCTTRKELESFFNKYINFREEWGEETVNTFLNSWEDGMIFECSF